MTVQLTRTVRFCLGADGVAGRDAAASNTFAAWPPMRGLGRYYELHVTCTGPVDAATGYFINVTRIDEAVRSRAIDLIVQASGQPDQAEALGLLMRRLLEALQAPLDGSVRSLTLQLTPTYALRIEDTSMGQVHMSQQYEFSAAHRLHAADLSDQDNRRVFGKCNNPSGHGHNYRFEVTVRCDVDETGRIAAVEQLDDLVSRTVIERLDHKHLNLDVAEFAHLNPSVENIAMVIFDLLKAPLEQAHLALDQVRVWETAKTVCTYRG